jgi:uncharacterized protein DUF6941
MPEQKELYKAHLSMAIFCEKVLREADNVLSIIRVVDRLNVFGPTPEMAIVQPVPLIILVVFKSGFLRGKQKVVIRPISPTGKDMSEMSFPMLFEGDDERGNALMANLNMALTEEGLFWFDVYLNDEMVTRMPLRVAYQQTGFATPSGNP